jgi:hypothetical protein
MYRKTASLTTEITPARKLSRILIDFYTIQRNFPMVTTIRQFPRFLILVLSISCASFVCEGCSTVNVTARQAPSADDTYNTTVWALWWGGSDPVESVDCKGNGLKIVSMSTSWLYSLITVATLGAVVPMDVQYRCTSEPMQGGGEIGALHGGTP